MRLKELDCGNLLLLRESFLYYRLGLEVTRRTLYSVIILEYRKLEQKIWNKSADDLHGLKINNMSIMKF
jgi:hypothetical protein